MKGFFHFFLTLLYRAFSSPMVIFLWFYQLRAVKYSLIFMSQYVRNPTFEQSKLISSVRVLDSNIFAGLRLLQGQNIYDFKYDPLINGPYLYPPLFAFIGAIASSYPYSVTHLLWQGSVAGSLYLFLLLGGWYLFKKTHRFWLAVSFMVVGALSQLHLSQINYGHYFLYFLPIVFGIFLTNRVWLLSILQGFLMGISVYSFFFLPLVYLKGGWRPIIYASIIGFALQFPLFLHGQSFFGYFNFLVTLNKHFFERGVPFLAIRNLLYDTYPPLDTLFVLLVLALTGVIFINFLVQKERTKNLDLLFSFFVVASLLIDPLFSDHHLVIIYVFYLLNFHRPSFYLIFPFLFFVNDIAHDAFLNNANYLGFILMPSLRHVGVWVAAIYTLYLIKEYVNVRIVIQYLRSLYQSFSPNKLAPKLKKTKVRTTRHR